MNVHQDDIGRRRGDALDGAFGGAVRAGASETIGSLNEHPKAFTHPIIILDYGNIDIHLLENSDSARMSIIVLSAQSPIMAKPAR